MIQVHAAGDDLDRPPFSVGIGTAWKEDVRPFSVKTTKPSAVERTAARPVWPTVVQAILRPHSGIDVFLRIETPDVEDQAAAGQALGDRPHCGGHVGPRVDDVVPVRRTSRSHPPPPRCRRRSRAGRVACGRAAGTSGCRRPGAERTSRRPRSATTRHAGWARTSAGRHRFRRD